MALPFGMSLSPWIFTKLMNIIATHLPLHAVSLFPYLDDWLIRDLIHSRFMSHTKYTFQIHVVKNLGFIPNLKKSDLIPTKEFTFIGMEFLTKQKIVRVGLSNLVQMLKRKGQLKKDKSTNLPLGLVAMETENSHRLIMRKGKILHFLPN